MNVLVADDDAVSRLILETALRGLGHQVEAVANGAEAWVRYQETAPQVLILDWMMPEMDGLEVCRRVRAQPRPGYLYVILLTARSEREDRAEGLSAGADDFLVKPLDRSELAARLAVAERILRAEEGLVQANADLAYARRHELEIGAQIQRALLTRQPPSRPDTFALAALTIPSAQIDGDFFDFFEPGPGLLDVVVGDAMGKGVPAALVSAGTKTSLLRSMVRMASARGQAARPEEVIQHAYDEIVSHLIRLESFVTMVYARFDRTSGLATFVDCGHTRTVLLRKGADRPVLLGGVGGFPLGFAEGERYEGVDVSFSDGDLFVFLTDGITEATSLDGRMLGEEAVADLVAASRDLPVEQIVLRLRQATCRHMEGRPASDDFTCVVLRPGPVEPWRRLEETFDSRLDDLWSLREFVSFASASVGLTEVSDQQLQLAVHEAATNVVKHAHGSEEGRRFDCAIERLSDGVAVELGYEGPPFLPEDLASPDFDNLAGHGLGLFLIEQMVDEVAYFQRPDGVNVVRMVKRSPA